MLQSTTPIPLPRGAKQPYLNRTAQHKEHEHTVSSCAPGPSSLSRTTLSQRFRRAIQQDDLSSAQRIAARAFELQFLPRTTFHEAFNQSSNQSSPLPPKAALRAAEAQRPSSAHPFDVRNVEPVSERIGLTKQHHHHHRKYTLAVHDEPLTDTASTADPSLVIAIKSNADVELVRWLIEMDHEQKAPSVDADGNTILHLATLYDRSDIIYAYSTYTNSHVAATLSDLIDADTMHDRRTALHLACIRGFDDVARQLLDLGADVDLQDRAGNTALHFASAWGHISLVQLLIERGCSLAVKNVEGSTPSDYAYSHSVKEALETMGRVRYESRKKTRRVPVATVMPAAIRPPATATAAAANAANAVSPQPDESSSSDRQARTRPFPSFLSRNGSNSGASRSSNTTPVRTNFVDMSADQTAEVIDDWDPEKTFAQPGQDLFPGNRGAFSSPPVQRVASPASFSTPARPSIDLYSEVLNHSPRTAGGFTPSTQHPHRAVSPQPRALAKSPPSVLPSGPMRSPDEAMMQWQAAKGLFPQSASEAEIRRQLSPNLGPIRRTPSPGNVGTASSADKVKMQDAAAMSLFRSTTPQPGVPGRIDTPPLNVGGRESPFMLAGATKGKNANANANANADGIKSPPPPPPTQTETTRAVRSVAGESTDGGTGGPPLLAPIATLPRAARSQGEGERERGRQTQR
ncbi:related to HOS4 - subunit of the Set3 complex [Ustilago trichophora]|uniref:Related to HOS4 - subunit of the Set3 complex n=1 Tax=Ustilago trichophora TaxID=86804 RepID=A0A5C3EDH9_9BASI|nr:related to HOS4 - subunit of the Set3 complex [Ustilago trichophora]